MGGAGRRRLGSDRGGEHRHLPSVLPLLEISAGFRPAPRHAPRCGRRRRRKLQPPSRHRLQQVPPLAHPPRRLPLRLPRLRRYLPRRLPDPSIHPFLTGP